MFESTKQELVKVTQFCVIYYGNNFVILDVGRSCILVSMGGKNIMLDCGMHMGFNDEVRIQFLCKLFIETFVF